MAENPANFESAFSELQQVVQRLEGGRIELDEMLRSFERGVNLIRDCRRMLDSAQGRILELVEIDDNGCARLRDFEHQPSVRKQPARSVKKTADPVVDTEEESLLF